MKRAIGVSLALLCLLTLTSCYGLRQINELAIVTAVGLDLGEKPDTIRVSVQIIRPADARGQTGAPSGGTGEPIYSVSAEGKSIFEAIRNLGQFTSRRVYWAHNFVIVMHEDYAKKGITDMVDFFTRNHELRMNTWVAVTPDSPAEVISTITGLEVVPGEAVDRLFRDNEIIGLAPGSNMMSLEETFLSRSIQSVLAKVSLKPRGISNKKPGEHGSIKQVDLAGAAVFQRDRMVGWLTPKDARGLLFFIQNLESGIQVLSCPNRDANVTAEFRHAKTKVKAIYRNGELAFDVQVKTDADIVESGCDIPISEIRSDLTKQLEKHLKKGLEDVVDKSQHTYRSDFLKLGDVFRNEYPREWHKLSAKWEQVYADAKVNVTVKADITSTVLKAAGRGVK
ncbi:Ger(x)C family spore germination protein [Paenibacillus sp. MMS18-CY102]|uniref:Ger(x)C family spore germination protein n=1 Tax=Paenibacillus sp. MMS18-CY102 TaxID=2682849 RepID=UPI001365AB8F|nr:Ger(x)C family spore germination protein [Paenibacillus sp. MMS18-CY102]MWC27741.1 Ger(x)C family spore germination protein [Paenibacillus sp. MMS18-CY102]